jgi:hypothetical protein
MSFIRDHNQAKLHSYLIRVKTTVLAAFGETSHHYKDMVTRLNRGVHDKGDVNHVIGLLIGGLDDLKGGYLVGQELRIASEIGDSLVEQAEELLGAGHVIPAAVLGRVVLEDALRRISRAHSLADDGKAARLNDELKKAMVYGQPMWRQVQAWLDVGNAAAHGKTEDLSDAAVRQMLSGVATFVATELR